LVLRAISKPSAAATLLAVVALAGCGESAQKKATAQVCSARSDISAQISKLEELPLSASSLTEAKTGFEAMSSDLTKIKGAQGNLAPARKQQVQAATESFESQLTVIVGNLATSFTSGDLEGALKGAKPQLKTALNKLAEEYRRVLGPITCS
jgi:hypothetical protein